MDSNANSERGGRPGSFWWLLWAAVALSCFAAAVYFSGRERQYVEEDARLRRKLESSTAALDEWEQARVILTDPSTLEVAFGAGEANAIEGRIFVNPGLGLVLLASHLPPVPPGKTYEMWFIQAGQRPVAAGRFSPQNDGSAVHMERNATAAVLGASLTVTLESAGVAQPSSAPILTVAVPGSAPR